MTAYSDLGVSPAARYERAIAMVGLTKNDLALIVDTSYLVTESAEQIVVGLYDHLTSFPEAKDLFERAHNVSGDTMKTRVASIHGWLREVIALVARAPDLIPDALTATGRSHAGQGKGGVVIPLDLMLLTMAYLQESITRAVDVKEGGQPAAAAWRRFLWVAFDLMAATYDDQPRTELAAGG